MSEHCKAESTCRITKCVSEKIHRQHQNSCHIRLCDKYFDVEDFDVDDVDCQLTANDVDCQSAIKFCTGECDMYFDVDVLTSKHINFFNYLWLVGLSAVGYILVFGD